MRFATLATKPGEKYGLELVNLILNQLGHRMAQLGLRQLGPQLVQIRGFEVVEQHRDPPLEFVDLLGKGLGGEVETHVGDLLEPVRKRTLGDHRSQVVGGVGHLPDPLGGSGVRGEQHAAAPLAEQQAHRGYHVVHRDGGDFEFVTIRGGDGERDLVLDDLEPHRGVDLIGNFRKIGPGVVVEEVATDRAQHGLGAVNGHRLRRPAEDVLDQEGQRGGVVHMGMGYHHVLNRQLFFDGEGAGDGAGVHRHIAADQKRGHAARWTVSTEAPEHSEFHAREYNPPDPEVGREGRTVALNIFVRWRPCDQWPMTDHDRVHASLQRLGLLLAGAGPRVRRLLASPDGDGEPFARLARCGVPGVVIRTARRLARREAVDLLDRVEGAGWRWLVPADAAFPALLRTVSDPPFGLFVKGALCHRPVVAVVGSRAATSYGRQVAGLLGEELARARVVVVSGMARGVDGAAHEGALRASGETWAVWGTGPDRIYPPEHGELASAIARVGALITEYPPGTPPRRHHFPQRNRLIAGLAGATVVVEAAARSGALGTAHIALDEGREVLAVPGSVFSERSVGPNTLLRLGARPLLNPSDVIEIVGGGGPHPPSPRDDDWEGVLAHLPPGEARTCDELAAAAAVPVAEVLVTVLQMEVDGRLERQSDGRYVRVGGMAGGGAEFAGEGPS